MYGWSWKQTTTTSIENANETLAFYSLKIPQNYDARVQEMVLFRDKNDAYISCANYVLLV